VDRQRGVFGVNVKEPLARGYAFVFARDGKVAQAVNHTLYHLALRGMGYNNGWQPERSGEEWFVRSVLAPRHPRVCLDVGANVGEYSRLLLQYTSARVVAVEPLIEAYHRLEGIARTQPRLVPVNRALGNERTTAELHFGDPTTEHASLAPDVDRIAYVGGGNTRTVTVQVDTLDQLLEELEGIDAVDFIKIDVEGFEHEVLLGARRTIETYRPSFVQIEWNLHQLMRGHTLLQFRDLLGDYDAYQLLPHGMRLVDAERPEANTFCYGNFVFVRSDVRLKG
jgi:FkbM family methyltransferase